MNTRKLYYEDCHLRVFSATVTSCQQTDKGYAVTLDATAFYPEGGGQACDVGTLGDANVLDVREKEDIIHLCDKPLAVGSQVEGRLDYERRLYQMQQHTGEHIVSGVVNRLYGGRNVGFHVGADVVTLDFNIPISMAELWEVERQANEAVFRNLPVKCFTPDPEELKTISYRAKRELPWPVRIVEIPDYDTCACCGVHVERTGELGMIKLLSCIKFHEGVRVEMVCGKKAYQLIWEIFEQNRQVSQAFSAKMLETAAAAQKMNDFLAKEKFRVAALERKLFALTAQRYEKKGDVVHFEDSLEPASVRALAEAIAQSSGGTAAVFSQSENGHHLCLVNKQAQVRDLGQALCAALGGKGGGKAGFFQGSVQATREQIEGFFSQD